MYNGDQQLPPRAGLLYLQAAILVLFTLIVFRLWYFQIYKGQELQERARNNITRIEPLYAPRGMIRDRKGVLLADNNPSYGLAVIRENAGMLPGCLSRWPSGPEKTLVSCSRSMKMASSMSNRFIPNYWFPISTFRPWPG